MPAHRANQDPLRVAFLAGTLAQGGAEKQLLYMTRALVAAGVEVRVYCLTAGEHYEPSLRDTGARLIGIGRQPGRLRRMAALGAALAAFRPHVLQAAHFYVNLYVALVGHIGAQIAIGSLRNDTHYEVKANGRWGPWLLHRPRHLIANSHIARANAAGLGVPPDRVAVVPNVIDLAAFDRQAGMPPGGDAVPQPTALAVGRLVKAKRFDRFLRALAMARQQVPELRGVIAGEGPEQANLLALAQSLGLHPGAVEFVGRRDDVPLLLRESSMLVSTSDHEGFPNVVMEAMAASRPVIATAAGDVPRIVVDSLTGYVIAPDDVSAIGGRMMQLALSPGLRRRCGEAGRQRVQSCYSDRALAPTLLDAYRTFALHADNHSVRARLDLMAVAS